MAQMTDETDKHVHEPREDNRCAKCRALLKRVQKGGTPGQDNGFKAESQGEETLSKRW
jgi:hypothetical protein